MMIINVSLPFFVGRDQLYLSSNQIARLVDLQFLGKESIDKVDFFPGDGHQGKLVSETIAFLVVARCASCPIRL